MSKKIVIIGAGSGFGARLSLDIMSRECLQDSEICLVDLHEGRLAKVYEYVKNTAEHYNLPTKIKASTDRLTLLKDADYVITSVAVGGGAYYGHPFNDEVRIPRKYGVDQSVADTISVGAVFRFLRTAPVHLQILRDVERLAPNCLHLNHTNPMSALTMLHNTQTSLKTIGLCHGIIATNSEFCRPLGVDPSTTQYKVAGINHMAWFLEWTKDGEDLYAKLDALLADKENEKVQAFEKSESTRLEIYRSFGYFPTESNRHDSEYFPYFRRTQEIRDYYFLDSRKLTEELASTREWMKDGEGDKLYGNIRRSNEYTTAIMEAIETGVPYRFNGNVMNTGLITNLPENCSVEVPCLVDSFGIHPTYVGALPTQCAALNRGPISQQQLMLEAVVRRDRDAAFHACCVDPLASSVCTLPQLRDMFEELWSAETELLTWFDKGHTGPVPEIYAAN